MPIQGGVGKTSCAAATALHFADQSKKTLIISTDPAHSLSDSFEVKIGGEIKKLNKNLYAVEIDPKKAMEEYKQKISLKMEGSEYLKNLGLEDTFDMAGMTPGIDEIAAFDKFLQYMQSRDYDLIIFDTAPTGHTLRFLSLPEVLDSWIGKMIMIRMRLGAMSNFLQKIMPFGNPEEGSLGTEQMKAMKKRIEEAKKTLSDPKRTKYFLITIPETMSILESERSINVLKQYHIPVETIIVNQLIPENSHCVFCKERRSLQLKGLKEINKKFSRFKILRLPLFKEEVKGFKMLKKVGDELYKNR